MESRSEHPLGKAVLQGYQEKYGNGVMELEDFQMIPGRGIIAVLESKRILAGNIALLEENHIEGIEKVLSEGTDFVSEGCTIIYVAMEGKAVGFISLADTLRPDALNVVSEIRVAGAIPVLLTGDHEKVAKTIATSLSIREFHAACLPEDKLKFIMTYQEKKEKVCMIGDGINDAPALKKAHVGIAMGGVGSDIAVDAADIVLVNDDIRELPHLLRLSKCMMRTIKRNLFFSMLLNFVAIVLAMVGILNPVVGALVHNAGSFFVIVNSAFLLRWH